MQCSGALVSDYQVICSWKSRHFLPWRPTCSPTPQGMPCSISNVTCLAVLLFLLCFALLCSIQYVYFSSYCNRFSLQFFSLVANLLQAPAPQGKHCRSAHCIHCSEPPLLHQCSTSTTRDAEKFNFMNPYFSTFTV